MAKKGCFGKSRGCCLGGCSVSVLLLIASPFLVLGGISWLDYKYDAGEADWAEGISEIHDEIGYVLGEAIFPSTPACDADHCDIQGNAISAEDSSLFRAAHFPFLQGRIGNFYSKDVDGFQDHWSLYRFDASADLIDELVQKADWEQTVSCDPQSFQRRSSKDWWQPEMITDPVCYGGYSPTGSHSYSVIHSPEQRTTYMRVYWP